MKKLLVIFLSVMMLSCLLVACDSGSGGVSGSSGATDHGTKSDTYEKLLERVLKFKIGEGTRADVLALFPSEYWEIHDVDRKWAEFEEEMHDAKSAYENLLGSNLRASYRIAGKEVVTGDGLDYYRTYLAEEYGINESEVEKAYIMSVEVTIEGNESEKTESYAEEIVCIHGQWYGFGLL